MIDYTNSNIIQTSVHQIGNKTLDEGINLSNEPLDTTDPKLRELLLRYFVGNFKSPEIFSFTFSNGDFELNPIFKFASQVFDNKNTFHKHSRDFAMHLFESSLHPNIKSGDFYVVYFTNLRLNDESTDAIGLFKSETKDVFLKLISKAKKYEMQYDDGVNIDKLDKGCLIFNLSRESGYQVCIVDKSNKLLEAQYWKNGYLNLKPSVNDYNHTKNYLNLAKAFVADQLPEDFEITKVDQANYLNRSLSYFKKKDQFNEREFAREVFEDTNLIKSFRKFKDNFQNEESIEFVDDFDISEQVVKKQSKIFKSVLKLDKNFHVYIHGDRGLIEQGVERDGRKYYKIYYKEES